VSDLEKKCRIQALFITLRMWVLDALEDGSDFSDGILYRRFRQFGVPVFAEESQACIERFHREFDLSLSHADRAEIAVLLGDSGQKLEKLVASIERKMMHRLLRRSLNLC
jgi:hypothetical protein